MGKIILDFGDGWNARFLESVYKNNDYDAGSMADDMIRMQLKKSTITDESNIVDERKKGKWIKRESITGLEQYYECSNCGNHCLYEYVEIGFKNAKTKFCPNCGAEMEVEK